MLTEIEKTTYQEDGFVIVPQVISSKNLQAMRDELENWIEESKRHNKNYGKTPNGKSQFDLVINMDVR